MISPSVIGGLGNVEVDFKVSCCNKISPLLVSIKNSFPARGFAENNEVVKRVGNSHSLPVYDFALQMPMKEKYWADGRHNNEEGVAKKAELFANFIATNKLINQEIEVLK